MKDGDLYIYISFGVEVNHFKRSIVIKSSHIDDPLTIEFQDFFVVDFAEPKIDFSEIFLDLDPDTIEVFVDIFVGCDEGHEDVLPETVAFGSFKTQNESPAVLVVLVLPDRSDFFLEEVDV